MSKMQGCIFLPVFPDPCIWCSQPTVADQKLWTCLQAGGVPSTPSILTAALPTTGLSASGSAPLLCRTWDLQFCSSCQQLLQRRSWSPWGDARVDVRWGPWRTGRPHPVWAQTTGGSIISPKQSESDSYSWKYHLFLCSYMRTLSLR